jgi:hypothetical protein
MKRLLALPKPALAVLLCCTLIAGCTASQITAYVNLAAQLAVDALSITSAFSGAQINTNDVALVGQWQQLIQKTANDIQANQKAGDTVLVAVLSAAETDLPAFLAAAHFTNPDLQNRIIAGTNAFLTIVESIAALVQPTVALPAQPAPVAMHGRMYQLPPRQVVPKATIINQWNAGVCEGVAACLAH